MNKYTYIVFGESGIFISKLLKEKNKEIKIIHFCETYMKDKSLADEVVNLDYDYMGCIVNEFAYYEELAKLDAV